MHLRVDLKFLLDFVFFCPICSFCPIFSGSGIGGKVDCKEDPPMDIAGVRLGIESAVDCCYGLDTSSLQGVFGIMLGELQTKLNGITSPFYEIWRK